jgi:type II secretory pathway component PulM
MTNDIKQKLGENTEKIEQKTKEAFNKYSSYYTNLEPYQRGMLVIVLLLALILLIYWLIKKEPRELTETEKKQIENQVEERILKRMEFLKKLRI